MSSRYNQGVISCSVVAVAPAKHRRRNHFGSCRSNARRHKGVVKSRGRLAPCVRSKRRSPRKIRHRRSASWSSMQRESKTRKRIAASSFERCADTWGRGSLEFPLGEAEDAPSPGGVVPPIHRPCSIIARCTLKKHTKVFRASFCAGGLLFCVFFPYYFFVQTLFNRCKERKRGGALLQPHTRTTLVHTCASPDSHSVLSCQSVLATRSPPTMDQ